MIRPEELIGQLLLRHNCVIVPGFGGFVAQRVAAVIDSEKGSMLPPRKALLFNRQLINNDGLLTAELANVAKIDFETATQAIHSMVQHWNNELTRGARVTIDKVGFLFFDKEKNLCFEQDRFFNLLLESFGLGKVHFVFEEQKETKVIELHPENETTTTIVDQPKRALWKYAAAACFLPLAFYSFWIPAKTNVLESGMFSIRDFNPFFKQKPAAYQKQAGTNPVFSINTGTTLEGKENYTFLPGVTFPLKGENQAQEETSIQADESTGKEASKQFIVGCFGSEENVRLMLDKLQTAGLEGYVYDTSNGLTRVSAGGSENESDLAEIRNKLTALGIRGWIFRSN